VEETIQQHQGKVIVAYTENGLYIDKKGRPLMRKGDDLFFHETGKPFYKKSDENTTLIMIEFV